MPNYRSDFDDGKYSIWICQAASNYYWIIGSTDDMPNCIGMAYRQIQIAQKFSNLCVSYLLLPGFFLLFFSPIGKSTSIEDANNVNNWNVWNGVSWKPASDLTLVAVHILG